jgi:hypothetical protein
MKKIIIYTVVLLLSIDINAQQQFTNFGNVKLFTGSNMAFFGDFVNNSTYTANAGTVIFDGSAAQTISGTSATTFYNLTFNNTFTTVPQISLGASTDIFVNNILSMGSNDIINLNGRTLTLGTSVGSPGTLSYTNGFVYGGTFTRWISASSAVMGAVATNELGHFPMGTSEGDYRPLWIDYSTDLSAGGTVSVMHNPTYPSGVIAASHVDGSWAGGTTLQGVSNSTWVVTTANGYALNGTTGIMRYGGQGFNVNQLSDLDASLTSSVVGIYGASTSVYAPVEVNRTGLATSNLVAGNIWRIGTKNISASPLPVELLSFNAVCGDNKVKLNWATASETNNNFFTVLKSTDGTVWSEISNVPGAGNSNQIINYSFTDNDYHGNIAYYRLKQTDYDGSSTWFNISSVDCNAAEFSQMSVYPNPAVDFLNIRTGSSDHLCDVKILSMEGKLCYSGTITGSASINVSILKPALYYIIVTDQVSGEQYKEKIVVN